MKIKTSELEGHALDWAVAKAEGNDVARIKKNGPFHLRGVFGYHPTAWSPTTNWSQGGPIIEREKINTVYRTFRYAEWVGSYEEVSPDWDYWDLRQFSHSGPTPLIAAMRCFVASKLGDFIEVPDALTEEKK
jgi:hypothetical protein